MSSSRLPTTSESGPVTDVKRSALARLFSTTMGISDHRKRFVSETPGPDLTLDLSLSSAKVSSPCVDGVHDPLGVVLVDREREQRLGQLLGGLGAGGSVVVVETTVVAPTAITLTVGQQQAGRAVVLRVRAGR